MIFRLRTPIDAMAIITDAETRQADVLDVDAVAILSIVINSYTGVAQFALGFGGLDPDGKFHLDPERAQELVHVTIDRRFEPAAFDAFFLEADGNPRTAFDAAFFVKLAKEVLFPAAYQRAWGAPYPDIEILSEGETLFQGTPSE
jgi:hypothetical protein